MKNEIIAGINNSSNRKNILIKNIVNTVLLKGLGIFIGIFTLPLYIEYFDNQKILGIWLAIFSIISWINNFDLGIGNGLRNKVTYHINKQNTEQVHKYISSAYYTMGFLSIFFILVSLIIVQLMNLNAFFLIPNSMIDSSQLKLSILILIFGVIIQFLFKLVFSILYAIENITIPNLTILISNVSVLIFLFFAKFEDLNEKFFFLACFNAIFPNFILLTISIYTFKKYHFKIKIKYVSFEKSKNVLNIGGKFFAIQILLMLILSTNEFLISWMYDSKFVVDYQIYSKWFLLIITIFSMLSQPMWASISNAYAQNDMYWINSIFIKYNKIANYLILLTIILVLLFQKIVDLWLSDDSIEIEFTPLITFFLIVSSILKINVSTTIANSFNKLNVQLYTLLAGLMIKILTLYIFKKFDFYWEATLISTFVAILPLLFIQTFYSKQLIKSGGNNV